MVQIDTSPTSLLFGHKSLRRQEPGSPLRRSRNTSNVSLEVTVKVHSSGTIRDPQMRFASDRDNASSSSDSSILQLPPKRSNETKMKSRANFSLGNSQRSPCKGQK